jgi:predicted TIM-barrel fold metal-dependent hydrolase
MPPYSSFEPVLRLAEFPNVYAKIGDYQIASKQSYPWPDTHPFVRLLVDRFGPQRMMWGTGYPRTARLVPLEQALRYVREDLPLSEDERTQILWDTPARLFGFGP